MSETARGPNASSHSQIRTLRCAFSASFNCSATNCSDEGMWDGGQSRDINAGTVTSDPVTLWERKRELRPR